MQIARLQGSQDPRGELGREIHDCELGMLMFLFWIRNFRYVRLFGFLSFESPNVLFGGLKFRVAEIFGDPIFICPHKFILVQNVW